MQTLFLMTIILGHIPFAIGVIRHDRKQAHWEKFILLGLLCMVVGIVGTLRSESEVKTKSSVPEIDLSRHYRGRIS